MTTDAQTEARAVFAGLRLVFNSREDYDTAVDRIATALAAKDAELAEVKTKCQALDDECQQSMLDIARERDRAERAEAQLAEANKALEPFADIADLIDAETEGMSETDELALHFHDYLMASWPVSLFRSARRAREVRGGDDVL